MTLPLTRCWAKALAAQDEDADLKAEFAPVAEKLAEQETAILEELNRVQGQPVELSGYYAPDEAALVQAMRPSATFNGIVDAI
jgi:isocitrate dehydrogenase